MYLNHFGLREKPFKAGHRPGFVWLGARQKETLDSLVRDVLGESRFAVVTGGVGTGKTTLADMLLTELGGRAVAAKVTCPDVEGVDFLKLIAKAYGLGGGPRNREAYLEQFSSFLRSSFSSGKPVVLIIDEAQRLGSDYLAMLFHLSDIRENGEHLLKIVFVGETGLEALLAQAQGGEPGRNVASAHRMEKLTGGEVAKYIAHRLHNAGCEREIFPPGTIEEVFSISRGVPALINMVCDLCLSRTFIKGGDAVRPETVKECSKLLRIPEEKAVPVTDASMKPHEVEVVTQTLPDKSTTDGLRGTLAGKLSRVQPVYAAAIGFLVVSIGVVFLMMPGTPSDPGDTAVRKEAGPPTDGSTGSDMRKAPAAPAEDRSARVTEARKRETVGSRRSTEQNRQAQAERSRREREAAADGAVGDTSAEREGAANRAPARPGSQDVESGKVIDWLIKKRSQ